MNPTNIIGTAVAYLASFAVILLVLGRRGFDEVGRLIRRNRRDRLALVTLVPVLMVMAFTVGAAWGIRNAIHGGATIADIAGIAKNLALFALVVPWARFALVDLPMSETWWSGSKHLVACIAISVADGCFQAASGDRVNALLSFLGAALWALWRRRGGGGWDFDNAPQPDPVTGHSIGH